MAPTDEELLELMPQGFRDDLALVSRMAAHGAGPEVQPGLFRVTLNTGALDYARAVWDRARALLAQPEPEVVGPMDDASLEAAAELIYSDAMEWAAGRQIPSGYINIPAWQQGGNSDAQGVARRVARAVLARFGGCPAPAAEVEVAELVAWLRMMASQAAEACQFTDAENLSRAADLLEQRQVENYAVTLPDVREVISWLTAEADRAERGEVQP